jgi:tetraspanin-7
VIVLIVGIWTQWELQQYIKLSQLYYETTPYVLIGVGVAIIVVATLGCCCTIRGYGRLLYMVSELVSSVV